MISIAQAFQNWESEIKPLVGSDDVPALSESWNDYTDMLCKDGELCALQYHYCPAYDDEMPGEGSRWDVLSDDRAFILERMGVNLTSKRIDKRPGNDGTEWDASASHWRVTITRNGKRMVITYSMGSAHTGTPDDCDVIASLLTDAQSTEEDFSGWCDSLGYDTDSRKAERAYKACKRIAASLARLFSSREISELNDLFGGY